MRRFLAYAATLLLFAVAVQLLLDRANVALLTHSSGNAAHKMLRLFRTFPKDEIPILGSSRASQNFVPSLLSQDAFNYGMDGSGQGETFLLLEAVLGRDEATPVIVNLDPWGFPDDGGAVVGDYRLVLDDTSVRACLPPERRRLKDRIPGIRFYGSLRPHLASWLNERTAATKRIDRGATLQRFGRTPQEWAVINATIRPTGFSANAAWKARIEAMARRAQRPIVWVVGPCSPHWAACYAGKDDLRAFLRWLDALPRQTVIDLYGLPYGEELFMDPTHLNLEGAERFTRTLLAELRKHPTLAPFFRERRKRADAAGPKRD